MREDKIKQIIGDLQSIYDGDYSKGTGTLGVITYKSRFTMLGCITPMALDSHHTYLSRIGPRFLSYRVPKLTEEECEEGYDVIFRGGKRREEALYELRALIAEHIKELLDAPVTLEEETPQQQQVLKRMAELLAAGRGVVNWERSLEGHYEIDKVQSEEPFRALQQLRTLARALARVHGRSRVTDHELELLRRVVLSSLVGNRLEILELFRDHPNGLTAKTAKEQTGRSLSGVTRILDELSRLGLLIKEKGTSSGGAPPYLFRLVPKYAQLILTPYGALDHVADLGNADFFYETPHRGGGAPF